MNNKEEYVFRVITLGNYSVGKTSIIRQYIENEFRTSTLSTIGIEFNRKKITIDNGEEIKLKIIDTSGQEKYQALSKGYFKNADGILFVFSMNDKRTLQKLEKWIDCFDENCKQDRKIIRALVGNKIDLEREVTKEEAQKFAEINRIDMFMETSAKTGENAQQLLIEVAKFLYIDSLNYKKKVIDNKDDKKEKLKLNENEKVEIKTKKKCC